MKPVRALRANFEFRVTHVTLERKMRRGSRSYLLLSCLLFAVLSSLLECSEAQPAKTIFDDKDALLQFKNFTDTGGVLGKTWNRVNNPCDTNPAKKWVGIRCSSSTGTLRVSKVIVPSSQLNGTFPENTLGRLTELRSLDLSNNSFSGPFPSDLSNLNLAQLWAINASFSGPFPNISMNSTRLTTLHLSRNSLNGSIPDLTLLPNLLILDLSLNSFQGIFPALPSTAQGAPSPTPSSKSLKDSTTPVVINTNLKTVNLAGNNLTDGIPNLSHMQNLTDLDLSHNSFNGTIPFLPSTLVTLDLSSNSLSGTVPADLANKFPNAFQGNAGLCGPPTTNVCSPGPPTNNDSSHAPGGAPGPSSGGSPSSKLITTRNAILIAVGAVVFILLIALCIASYFSKKDKNPAVPKTGPLEKTGDSSAGVGMSSMGGDSDRSKLSFIDDSQQGYDLEDLLRASAEMLGKGSFGTAYKAVMESGMIVAVKRLRDVKDIRRAEFSQHMELLGRLKHPNVVPLRAYYYAREEKLLIYEFMPNGSLASLLHVGRTPGRTPLEWPARLSIAQGVARGLTYLHKECGHKIPHANIKSSNVLMGKNFEVCISDFGLVPLMPPQVAAQRMAGYRAPEYAQAKKITYKADVYSFGILLLELLTGRQPAQFIGDKALDLPKWVHSVVREEWTGEVFDPALKSHAQGEEELVTLLQIAMSCVQPRPDERPEMFKVVELLEGIRRGESAIDSESYQSHSTEGDYSSRDLAQSI